MMNKRIPWLLLFTLSQGIVFSQNLEIKEFNNEFLPAIVNQEVILEPPNDGLWSISMDWQDN